MDGYSISQVAERTGFSASTLRFYEQEGLVHPGRTPAGYRTYHEDDLELLAFIGRAKGIGLSLHEITELLALLDQDRCAPVQDRLRALVGDKLSDAQERIAELVAFTDELQRVSGALAGHTPDGPCDDACGCTAPDLSASTFVASRVEPDAAGTAIACTLPAGQVPGRITTWQTTVDQAVASEALDHGVRLRFDPGTDVAALAELAAAEQDCCHFFTFAITIDDRGVTFDVTGPDDARPMIDALAHATR
jgi:DNA-binding transcriptional MerR regulator